MAPPLHYLPLDAIGLITRHLCLAGGGGLLGFGAVYALLRHRFGRGGVDVLVAGLFCAVLALFVAACLYLLATRPGYHVYHPGF